MDFRSHTAGQDIEEWRFWKKDTNNENHEDFKALDGMKGLEFFLSQTKLSTKSRGFKPIDFRTTQLGTQWKI